MNMTGRMILDDAGIEKLLRFFSALPTSGHVNVGVNGLMNELGEAAGNLGRAFDNQRYFLAYNPSQGIFADLGQSLRDAIGLGTDISKQLSMSGV